MEQFPSNSRLPKLPQISSSPDEKPQAPKPEEKKIEKVVEGEVIRRKKSLGKRFAETFFSGEAPKSVLGYVLLEVLIPAAKDMIVDAGQEALQRMVHGSSQRNSHRTTVRQGGATSIFRYDGISRNNRPNVSHQARTTQNFDELVFATRAQASQVIDEMHILLERFGMVSVGEFFDLAGVTAEFTDRKYGWTDLRGVTPRRVREGFIIDLPRPEPLNNH